MHTIATEWPQLEILDIEGCEFSAQSVEFLLKKKDLKLIRLSDSFDSEEFKAVVKSVSSETIVMVKGRDIMNQPESAFDELPWGRWD